MSMMDDFLTMKMTIFEDESYEEEKPKKNIFGKKE